MSGDEFHESTNERKMQIIEDGIKMAKLGTPISISWLSKLAQCEDSLIELERTSLQRDGGGYVS